MATKTKNSAAADTADREMVLTRVVNAPRDLVWQVWTDPKHIGNWWGPTGFTITNREMDVRPGGVWRFVMHGPDGVDYDNKIVYVEIVKPERLVYNHGDDTDADHFQTTVTFEDQGQKTGITMRAVFSTAAALAFVVKEHGAIEGGKQTLGRLDEYVSSLRS